MSIECVILIVGIIIQVCSFHEWYQIAIGRFVAGLGVGGLSAAVPMYQGPTFLFNTSIMISHQHLYS